MSMGASILLKGEKNPNKQTNKKPVFNVCELPYYHQDQISLGHLDLLSATLGKTKSGMGSINLKQAF
jgi:hypothetical protein